MPQSPQEPQNATLGASTAMQGQKPSNNKPSRLPWHSWSFCGALDLLTIVVLPLGWVLMRSALGTPDFRHFGPC